jgi:hypothetical protein
VVLLFLLLLQLFSLGLFQLFNHFLYQICRTWDLAFDQGSIWGMSAVPLYTT